jgi:hypothetical protein
VYSLFLKCIRYLHSIFNGTELARTLTWLIPKPHLSLILPTTEMRHPLTIPFIYLTSILSPLLHNQPAVAKRDPDRRSQAWCEVLHEKAGRPAISRTVVDSKAYQASKDCCATILHFAYFNEAYRECWGQGGLADNAIHWKEYKDCCRSREDAGVARSNDFYSP